MKISLSKMVRLSLFGVLISAQAQASFFDDIKKAVEQSAKDTATDMAAEMAEDMIRDMFVGYSTEQTKTEKQVVKEYKKTNNSLPLNTTASSYKTQILPGSAVSPGTKVRIKSRIEIIPGRNGERAQIEEQLTIYDNEDNSLVLKSMTKEAQRSAKGGQFEGEFSFTLPEGLPQGVYPIRLSLLLNGDIAGDSEHDLQLVMRVDELFEVQLIAVHAPLTSRYTSSVAVLPR